MQNERTPLHVAADGGYAASVDLLIKCGATLDLKDQA